MRGDSVCWPLPWAAFWSEADMMDAAAELNNDVDTVAEALLHGSVGRTR